jgi:hypothetical protein
MNTQSTVTILVTIDGSVLGLIGLFDTAHDYTLQLIVTHTHTHTSVHSHVFTAIAR